MKKHITFNKLDIQNFKSVGELQTIDFNEFNGLTFINGLNNDIPPKKIMVDDPDMIGQKKEIEVTTKNGAGKSLLLDAILFVLYVKTISNSNNVNLQNRKFGIKLKTFGRLNMDVSGVNYVITTSLLNKGKTKTASIEIIIDGGEPMELNTPQAKAYIEEEILGCSFSLFKSAIVISNSSYVDFYDMKKAERIKYVEQLFGLDCFGNLLKAVRVDLNANKGKLSNININLVALGFDLDSAKLKFNDFDGVKKLTVSEQEAKLRAVATEVKKIQEVISKIEYVSTEELSSKHNKLVTEYNGLRDNKSTLESHLRNNETKAELICKSLLKHKEVLDVLCSTCLKKVAKTLDSDKSTAELNSIKEQIDKIELAIPVLNTKMIELNKEVQTSDSSIREVSERNRSIELVKTKLGYKVQELRTAKEAYDTELARVNPYQEIIESTTEKITKMKEEINKIGTLVLEFQAMEIMAGEDGAKADLLNELASNINVAIQGYLDRFGNRYTVKFDSSFDPVFVTTSGECTIDEFSAGERQRINLATMFTFRDNITNGHISSNLFILDEILDSKVDIYAISSIISMLQERAKLDNQKIWIISHNSDLVSIGDFDHKITANKTNDQTVYEVEHLK